MKNLLIALAAVLSGCDSTTTVSSVTGQANQRPTFALRFEGRSFHIELADSPELRQQGLAHRQYLQAEGGMLFVFPAATKVAMWMKGCEIPLDVFFFDERERLINFHTMAVPLPGQSGHDIPRYWSDKPAKYALELAAGSIPAQRLKPGTAVIFSPELLKALGKAAE